MKRYRPEFISILLSIVVLASCKTAEQYNRPNAPLPDQFKNTSFSDTSSVADIEWRQFFTDPALQSLIQKALVHNNDLLLATKRLEASRLIVNQSNALNLPEVSLQVTGQYNRPSNNSLNGLSLKNFVGSSHIENYNAFLGVTWEVDIWGKIKAQKGIALAQYLQTFEGAKAVQTGIVSSVAQGYSNLVMLHRQLVITRRNLALSDSFVTATKLLKDAGMTNALAVQQAEAQKLSIAMLVPQLELRIGIQENNLQLLSGELPASIAIAAETSLQFPQLTAGLPSAVVSRRPDVRSSELALIAATEAIGIARANMYPALNITAGGGLESFRASNWFNLPNSLFGLAAGTIAQPIFQRKALRTRYQTARNEREQAVIRFRQSVLNAITEVSNALLSVEKTTEQEKLAQAQVAALQTANSNSQSLFKSDMASYLEVITAQANVLQAQLNLAAVQQQRWNASIELYRSLGGGWK